MAIGVGYPSTATRVGGELGGYHLVSELGAGGMGVVYLGEHRLLGRRAAVKTIRPEIAADPSFGRRFQLEAMAIAGLDHPSIVRLYDFAHDGDLPYMVMEYVTGRTLQDLLADHPVLEPPGVLSLLTPVAAALDHAHAHGVIHRDVKPGNILVADDGRVLLMDFGLACLQDFTMATDPSCFLGTPEYVAPEQITGRPLTGTADIYSLAALIFEAVSGRRPFTGKSWIEVASQRLTMEPPLARGVPADFARALATGMMIDPLQRPRTAIELLARLAAALRAAPTRAALELKSPEPGGAATVGVTAACLAGLVAANELLVLQASFVHVGALIAINWPGH